MSLKLLILTSEFAPRRGGIGTYAMELARAASELGYQVTVAAPDYGADQGLSDATLPFEVIRFKGRPHTMRQLPYKVAFLAQLSRERPDFDIVHAADWPFYLPLALSRYRKRARCLITFHGTEVTFMQNAKRAWMLRAVRFWNGWTEYVANSRYTAQAAQDAFPVAKQSVRPIGLGVSQSWLGTQIDKQASRTKYGLQPDRFVIASLGRIVPRKGHLVLAQALSMMDPAIAASITWIIIGPPMDPDYAHRLAEAVSTLPADVQIKGALPVEDIHELLAGSDLFCLPGFIDATGAVEGFGLVYLEAAALGVPSVATYSGGIPDAVIDGQTGLLAPPNDPRAIADAIIRLYDDRGQLARLAAQARMHAKTVTWQSVAKATYGHPTPAS